MCIICALHVHVWRVTSRQYAGGIKPIIIFIYQTNGPQTEQHNNNNILFPFNLFGYSLSQSLGIYASSDGTGLVVRVRCWGWRWRGRWWWWEYSVLHILWYTKHILERLFICFCMKAKGIQHITYIFFLCIFFRMKGKTEENLLLILYFRKTQP